MTDIKATPETIRAVAAALGRARLFDDKIGNADSGRIAAWAEAVEPFGLSQKDMLNGVTAYYGGNKDGRTMQAADLAQASREYRRDVAERESAPVLDARQKALERKVAADVAELAATKSVPLDELKFRRPKSGALAVRCPWCRASIGNRCTVPRTTQQLVEYHPSRIEAAMAVA